jgi:membrane protein
MLGVASTTMERAQERARRRPWRGVALAVRQPLRFVAQLVGRVQDDDVLTIAAAMAFYFFLSLFPLCLFVVALVSVAPVSGLETWMLEQASQLLPGEAYTLLEGTLRDLLSRPQGGLVSLGAVLALWTASSAFVSVMGGLSRAYRAPEYRAWWRVRLRAIGLTVGLSLVMIVTFVLTIFGGQMAKLVGEVIGPAAGFAALVIRWTVALLGVTVVVVAIDHAGPATPRTWRWVTPGSLVFIGGFAAASAAFSYYVGRFASYNATYGSLGAVIVMLLWLYILAVFLLLGGEVNALLEHLVRVREEEAAKAMPREGSGEPVARGQALEA